MKRIIIAPLLLCCLALSAFADTVQLQEDHPERYVVVKGDTLWDISARFLKDPWLWPKVWKMNREQIKNPHLIYPGDVVVLDLNGGEPQLRLLRETVKLKPGVREEALDKTAVPSIAPSVIAPFLSQPLVVETDGLAGAPKIIGAAEGRLLLAPGINIYADKIEEGQGVNWQIYRSGTEFIDPDTKEKLGTEAKYLGEARTVRYGEPATIQILRMKEDVNEGDRLVPPSDNAMGDFIPHAPDFDITGRVLSTYEESAEVGRNSIVAINRGSSDGLEQGHVLAIYRAGRTLPPTKIKSSGPRQSYLNFERNEDGSLKRDEDGKLIVRVGSKSLDGTAEEEPKAIKLPDERIGLLMVFRTFDRVSYALIMQAKLPVYATDIVTTP